MFPEPDEADDLQESWQSFDAETLDRYLVSGVEDPRINVPSVLTRGLLCEALFPQRFTSWIEEELRFGYVMTWLLTHMQMGVGRAALLSAIRGEDRRRCPGFVLQIYERLQSGKGGLPDYISAALEYPESYDQKSLSNTSLNTFQGLWRGFLSGQSPTACSLFEPACGSANDYRFLDGCGLARLLHYTGMDIAPKNIENARRRFPQIDFRVGDLVKCPLADDACDFSLVHDLFEHLSENAMERAVGELLRVTRHEVWIHCFNAASIRRHRVHPVGSYHWNTLSLDCLASSLRQWAARVDVISVASLARTWFGFSRYYNPNSHVLVARKSKTGYLTPGRTVSTQC